MFGSVIQLISGIICVDCFNRTANRQIVKMRIKFFQSIMRQEIGWHDVESGKTNFTVQITESVLPSNHLQCYPNT